MRKFKITILLIPLFFTAELLFAQMGMADCKVWLRKVYSSMEQNFRPSENKVLHLGYQVTTQMKEGSFEMSAELYSNNTKSWFISKDAEVYQDNSITVSVLPSKKLIYISDFTLKEQKESKLKQLSFVKDTLFYMANVTYCDNVKMNDGKECKKITLELSEMGKKLFKVESMDFFVDEKKEQLKEVFVKYIPANEIQEMNVKFIKMEMTNHSDKLNGTLLSNVMDGNGIKKPNYKNYQVTDNRSKKTTF